MNIGAGCVILQDLPRIDRAIAEGELFRRDAVTGLIRSLRASGGACHLMGLLSPGGVHSHQSHMAALARLLSREGIPVAVHAFLDGRDTPPASARGYLSQFLAGISDLPNVAIATISRPLLRDGPRQALGSGRHSPIGPWSRPRASGRQTRSAAVDAAYARGETDEFVRPTAIGSYRGMVDGDGLLMANFRADRARQILTALLDPDFDGFARGRAVRFAAAVGMVEYSEALNRMLATIFPPQQVRHTLGEVVAEAGLKQLRIAETEKYAHVTFFFNGGRER